MVVIKPIYLVKKINDDYTAIACISTTGAVYLVDGGSSMTLFTEKRQREFNIIAWDRETVMDIANKHNRRFTSLVIKSCRMKNNRLE